ncbi:MAG: aldehyde dehydrogenase family protein [candidate division Zixibacteria bacterium]|nr:aldehyde dehydrogenase family protein [candidate division Zixibacteria bacterium]
MIKNYRMLVGGKWVDSDKKMEVTNKYNHQVVATVPLANKELYEEAVKSAQKGLEIMSAVPAYQRSKILETTSQLLEKNKKELTELIATEAGKAWKHSWMEVERGIGTFKFASEEAKNIHSQTVPMDAIPGGEKRIGFILRFPVGIIGAISPFNYPLNLVAHKVAPAIAAGNSVILKPASLTPLTSLKLGEIMMEAGLPGDALNVIIGSGNTVGEWLIQDERLSMITFTGSPPVGRRIKEKSGLKKVTLELGSNSAAIIDQSADLNSAVPRCVFGSFSYAGQVCISVQRIYVHKKVISEFTQRFLDMTRKLKLGDPLKEDTDVGPMITEEDAVRTEEWVNEAVKDGAKILIGGKREKNFYYPTVLTNVKPEMKVMRLEAFAPIVSIIEFEDFSDAVKMVDDSIYGLQAGIFTAEIEKAFEAVKKIKVGGVIINDVPTYRADQMPYGGVKESGIGREGLKYAIEEMTDMKMVVFNLGK